MSNRQIIPAAQLHTAWLIASAYWVTNKEPGRHRWTELLVPGDRAIVHGELECIHREEGWTKEEVAALQEQLANFMQPGDSFDFHLVTIEDNYLQVLNSFDCSEYKQVQGIHFSTEGTQPLTWVVYEDGSADILIQRQSDGGLLAGICISPLGDEERTFSVWLSEDAVYPKGEDRLTRDHLKLLAAGLTYLAPQPYIREQFTVARAVAAVNSFMASHLLCHRAAHHTGTSGLVALLGLPAQIQQLDKDWTDNVPGPFSPLVKDWKQATQLLHAEEGHHRVPELLRQRLFNHLDWPQAPHQLRANLEIARNRYQALVELGMIEDPQRIPEFPVEFWDFLEPSKALCHA